jgi:polysaccharide export outer membrane protein
MSMRWLQLFLVLIVLPLGACATNRPHVADLTVSGPYAVDAGDVLRVGVYGEEALSKTYKVDGGGQISFPLAGPIKVRGLTTTQVSGAIAAALSGFMRHPDVSVEIDTYRPFYIQGGVANAGQFAFVPGMTVRAAISTAGGFTEGTSGPGRVTIYRTIGGQVVKSSVNLDFPIYPGDTILVGTGTVL